MDFFVGGGGGGVLPIAAFLNQLLQLYGYNVYNILTKKKLDKPIK